MANRNDFTTNVSFQNSLVTTLTPNSNDSSGTNDPEDQCIPVFRIDLVFFAVVLVLAMLYNALVFWAIVKSRKKLKQNFVYVYVGSLVVVNILQVANTLITIISFLTPIERPIGQFHVHQFNKNDPVHKLIMNWWTFRKALTLGLFLMSSANVAALIYGISRSASFVGRMATMAAKGRVRTISDAGKENQVQSLSRRQTAYLTIFIVWFIPLVYTVLAYAWNGCINYCKCLPAYYSKQHFCSVEVGPDANKCSNIWVPLANGYLLFCVVTWFLLVIVVFVLLSDAIKKYRKATKSTASGFVLPSKGSVRSNRDINENRQCKTCPSSAINSNSSLATGPVENQKRNNASPNNNSIKYKRRTHPTIKLLIALSISYTVCTTPIMLCFVIDASLTDRFAVDDITITVMSIVYMSYTIICPSLLVAYMAGLRKALVQFLLPCFCTKTTVVHKMTRLGTINRK